MFKTNLKKNLITTIVSGIEKLKGEDVIIIDLSEIQNSITENFIVCSGNSTTQVKALSNSIDRIVRTELKEHPRHIEGLGNNQWILIDYVSVVVHIFVKETRNYYNLENLWKHANIKKISSSVINN